MKNPFKKNIEPEKEKTSLEEVETLEEPEDRSAFDCPTCKGEGLLGDPSARNWTCPDCAGTGKSKH